MLYIVGTPLGNTEDISLRAMKVLSEADVVLAEDTRSFQTLYKKMCSEFKLTPHKYQKIISYHDQNEFQQAPYVLKILDRGKNVALVSEAGMPLISDPGSLLVKEAIRNECEITCIPGPIAYTTASVLTGFDLRNILFIGFLPKKESEKVKIFNSLQGTSSFIKPLTVCLYESPHRINTTLEIIAKILPSANLVIARELTKKFEEISRGSAAELNNRSYKGELTVVLSLE